MKVQKDLLDSLLSRVDLGVFDKRKISCPCPNSNTGLSSQQQVAIPARGNCNISLLKQDRKYTYDVTLRRVRATIFAVEKQKVLHILSVCL